MSKKEKSGGFGKFLGGLAVGAGLGILFAPDKGENTRKVLSKKIEELIAQLKEVDMDEVKDELLYKVETLQADLKELDKEKAKDLEDIYEYAVEKGTPVVEQAADEVRKQALKVVKEIEKKLESDTKKSKK